MSEKINIHAEVTQNPPNTVFWQPNMENHNSKRRICKQYQFPNELQNETDDSTVDSVVDFLCSSLIENYSDTNIPITTAENSVEMPGTSKINDQYYDFHNSGNDPLSSIKDLGCLLENLQMFSSDDCKDSNSIEDYPLGNTSMQTSSKSLTKNLKQQKDFISLQQESFTEQEDLTDLCNLGIFQNLPSTSVLPTVNSLSMKSVADIEQSLCYNVNGSKNNSNLIRGHKAQYSGNDLLALNNDSETAKLLSMELENILSNCKSLENGKKISKKKAKTKKTSETATSNNENAFLKNEKLLSNSESKKNRSCQQAASNVPQADESKKKEQNSKTSSSKTDNKFPNHLSAEELESLSNLGVLLSGPIRINQKNYKKAYITAPNKGMDIMIEGIKDRNRALEGDEVYFVLKPQEIVNPDSSEIQRTGVVVGIKTLKHTRGVIGTLNPVKNKNSQFAMLFPRDPRLPRIRIRKSDWPEGFSIGTENFKDNLYFARICKWDDLRFADGKIIKEIGLAGDLEAETNAILMKYDLDVTSYSDELKQYLPPLNLSILDYDIQNREDFRKDCVFTIDPATAVDLDDAVSCKRLPNGNYEVGVHISDVSFFLSEGTPLDMAISERATTIYLVQKTYHMLPIELCRMCSLTPGEDKFSFSVLWEVTPDCKILRHRFTRSVINSCAQLSYEQVQAVIDNEPSCDSNFPKIYGNHSIKDIKKIILFLHKMAVGLRKARFKNGALTIDQKKIYFCLDKNNMPVGFKVDARDPSHQLIEEFMLLANIAVAEKLNSTFPELAFLRCHPPPLQYMLEKLQGILEKYGIILDISTAGSLQQSLLNYYGDDYESLARMLVICNSLAKPMARAKYYCGGLFSEEADRKHYALSVPLYTHFTSPIRRYADVMVHRLLAASLNYCDVPQWGVNYVQDIASNCNKQKYAAKLAQEMSNELYFAIFIELKGPVVCDAVVCDIKDKSFDCIGLATGCHQRLYFERISGELKEEKEDGIVRLIVRWPKDENHDSEYIQVIEMFSIVKIELKRSGVLKIEAKLLRCR